MVLENSLRKLALKLNNTSLLFNALYYEAQDERKYHKDLQDDLKDTCFLFQNGLFQMKNAFESEDLKGPFEFYMEILKNPQTEDPKKLNTKIKVKNPQTIEKNVADYVEKKINNFLSMYAKADIDFEDSLKKILTESLETKNELKNTIASTLNQMEKQNTYVPKNDLKGLMKDMFFFIQNKNDNQFKNKLLLICKMIQHKSIDPKDCSYLYKNISLFQKNYQKFKVLENVLLCKRASAKIRRYRKGYPSCKNPLL